MAGPKRDEASQELDASLERISLGIERLQAENGCLREALAGLFGLVEDGTLVRDTSRDAESGWAMRQVSLVQKLAAARAALAASEPEDK